MYFDSLEAAIQMDGHGVFVWAAYAITVAVLALILIAPRRRARRALRHAAAQARRAQSPTQAGANA